MKKIFKKVKDSWITSIAIGIIVALLISNFIAHPIMVQGSSMYPTYKDGSIGFAGKMFNENNIKRNDIVVLETLEGKKIIKRVIGLPGEKVEYINHKLYINGNKVEDQFESITEDYYITVPKGEYFCLGDNRTNSRDSRNYGTFKLKQIFAKGVLILWPINL